MWNYVGIDVSKNKLDIAWLRDPEKVKIKTKAVPNNREGFTQLVHWLSEQISAELSSIHVVLEATAVYHESVAYALVDAGVAVSIVNPGRVHDFARSLGSQHKTDKKDSVLLARFGALTRPDLWEPERPEIRELKALLSRLSMLEKDLYREQSRQEQANISAASVVVVASIEGMIAQLQREIERVKQQIDRHIDDHPDLRKDRELLLSIPAVGEVLSRNLLALLHSRDFKNAGQVSAFIGLVPKIRQSGQWQGQSRLSKSGNGQIRAKMYLAAVVATRHNPDIRAQYERLLKAGKRKMQAIGAAMRKLVQICYGVLKHQSKYQPQAVF
tara:strand:- start:40 stop:1023 length:984 start_codon:yes stop_codon:yes gene_type:complete